LLKNKEDIIVQYVISDVSLALADNAARLTSYKWVSAKALDLAEAPEKQDFAAGSFDIITSFNGLHLTDVQSTLSSLKRLLVPGGSLLFAELHGSCWSEQPGSVWATTIFGSLPGWFDSLLSTYQWNATLLEAGYVDLQTSPCSRNGFELVCCAQRPLFVPRVTTTLPSNTLFIPFKYGEEMTVQAALAKLDMDEKLSVWLIAESGIDADAATGLVRCLIIEMNMWKVHLAIFDGITEEWAQADAIVGHLEFIEAEDIIRFDKDGEPHFPRLAPQPPPPPAAIFDPTGTWILQDSEIVQTAYPSLGRSQVLVEVASWSEPIGSFRGFTGKIADCGDSTLTTDQAVVGISNQHVSNRIVCDPGVLAQIPEVNERLAADALAILIGAFVLGPYRTSRSSRSHPLRIVATDAGILGKDLTRFFSGAPSVASIDLGKSAVTTDKEVDVAIIDSATLVAMPEVSTMGKKLFIWDKVIQEALTNDPSLLGYYLEAGLQIGTTSTVPTTSIIRPSDLSRVNVGSLVSTTVPLFSASKAYILIGGMSDVGIHVSTWMYKVRTYSLH
jgi:hypothetical protein